MTDDSWDDPTESIMGGFDEKSWEIDIDFANLPPTRSVEEMSADGVLQELWPQATRAGLTEPDLVVFDPMGFTLGDQLARMGFQVREAKSGVDVMTLVAARPTGAVVCGPAEDAERRRLLTAALRLRFPSVPVIYVSTHARNPAAVKGAKAEGAEVVVPLPLPPADAVRQELAPYARAVPPPMLPDPQTGPIQVDETPATLMLSAEELAVQKLKWASVTPQQGGAPRPLYSQEPPTQGTPYARLTDSSLPAAAPNFREQSDDAHTVARMVPGMASSPAPVSVNVEPTTSGGGFDVPTFDSEMPTDLVRPISPVVGSPSGHVTVTREADRDGIDPPHTDPELKGEVGALLGAISPFLWGLEDAGNYMQQLSQSGDVKAATHARTLHLLTNLLRQLKDRVDDLGL